MHGKREERSAFTTWKDLIGSIAIRGPRNAPYNIGYSDKTRNEGNGNEEMEMENRNEEMEMKKLKLRNRGNKARPGQ